MAHLASNGFKMNKGFKSVKLLLVLLVSSIFFITAVKMKKQQTTNETLILRNDSLHIQQLQTKMELLRMRKKYDSLLKMRFIVSP